MEFIIKQVNAQGETTAAASGSDRAALCTAGYAPGDSLVIETPETAYAAVRIHPSVAEAILYIPGGVFAFHIPEGEALRGFAPGIFQGPQTVLVRRVAKEELERRRNLCLNPLDYRVASEVVDPDAPEWSNPTDSQAVEQGEITAFPHAYANRVTRNEGCFYPRNAIDGISVPGGHGTYPYHSWGGGVHRDLTLAVYFGRPVLADTLALCLRSDYCRNSHGQEHDTYWHTAQIALSDGFQTEIKLEKQGEAQEFALGEHKITWLKLSRLDPLQHPDSLNFAALNQIALWGRDCL